MSHVMLGGIAMKRESKSFTDSLHAILTAAGLFEGPKYLLSGLSGMAFKFTVHERLLPLSVTAYGHWGTEHRPAVDNLGIWTIADGGRTRHPTFSYYQREAVEWVKESLDRGIGVMYWIPEFGVIHGYDDEDRVFFLQDGHSLESRVLLYDNFGINKTGFWDCRVFGERVRLALADMALESIRLAIRDWETPYKTPPNKDIASGRLAFSFLTRALASEQFDEYGAVYILQSYVQSRKEIVSYLSDVEDAWQELSIARGIYEKLPPLLSEIERCIVVDIASSQIRVDRQCIGKLNDSILIAQEIEEEAVRQFRAISARYPDLKRSTLPRWGVHHPR